MRGGRLTWQSYWIIATRLVTRITRPRRSRSVAVYSRQTFPWTICRSLGLYVHWSVGLSSASWKNGGSHPDAVWHHRSESDGSRDEADSGVWDRSTGRDTFGAHLGRAIVANGDFTAYVCDTAATRPSSQINLGRLVIIMSFTRVETSIAALKQRRILTEA